MTDSRKAIRREKLIRFSSKFFHKNFPSMKFYKSIFISTAFQSIANLFIKSFSSSFHFVLSLEAHGKCVYLWVHK